jgi:SAM-dependent methyltransferase
MSAETELAPGVPPDYYRSIADVEEAHWWHQGMVGIAAALLGPRLWAGGRALDAGCGTGGFLRYLVDNGRFGALAGADIASAAVELSRERVPEADVRVAPLHELPFSDDSFDLVVTNDVLQHVPQTDVAASLRELHRVLAPSGTLLVRTNGSRRLRQERDDWRAYDPKTLRRELEEAGFALERLTYANVALSLAAALRGHVPHAPSTARHGIPGKPSRIASRLGGASLRIERWWLKRGSLPYGHTLFAVAAPAT